MRVFVIVALILMLVPVVAQAEVTLNYTGDLPGNDGGNGVWDYRYEISGATMFNFGAFGIVCPVAPIVGSITGPSAWGVGVWSNHINVSGLGSIGELANAPGIVWSWDGITTYPSNPLVFSFQTSLPYSPVMQQYDGDSWTGKTTYSANPEPASLALLGLAMAGGTFWRRRRPTRR